MKIIEKQSNGKRLVNKSFFYLTCFVTLLNLSFPVFSNAESTSANAQLANSPSPYVAMHLPDKVQWRELTTEVLEEAKRQNKPIFLTIGYYSCYWCHVMQRESFQSGAVAELLNKNYIAAVVDRELHPAIDAHLMKFAEQTIGRGGWPLNVVLTPEGYPFFATIYLPEKEFASWLTQILEIWNTDPEYIKSVAQNAASELDFNFQYKSEKLDLTRSKKFQNSLLNEMLTSADEMSGGFGDQAKFPLAAVLQVALELNKEDKNSKLSDFLQLTLDNMARYGLYDHLDSGFFRYTTDPGWQIPHFEKMLYDNALLVSLYMKAGHQYNRPDYFEVAHDTLSFLITKMQAPDGGFYSSFSAIDSQGIEGGYYLWSAKDWQGILSEKEQATIKILWGWQNPPVLEEGFLPVNAVTFSDATKRIDGSRGEIESIVKVAKKKLMSERQKRLLPRDDKIITAWNALMLIALIDAFEMSGQAQYRMQADKLANFIATALYKNKNLYRSAIHGKVSGMAMLEDYAYTSSAFYRWYRLSGDKAYLEKARELARIAWQNFHSDQGWQLSHTKLIPYGGSEILLVDGPLPSPSAVLIMTSLGLEGELKARATSALEFGHGILENQPFWYASHVLATARSFSQ